MTAETTVDGALLDFTEEEVQLMLDNIDTYTPEEQAEIEKIADILSGRKLAKRSEEHTSELQSH